MTSITIRNLDSSIAMRSAIRRHSTDDRARHQRAGRTDEEKSRRGGDGLDVGPTGNEPVHDPITQAEAHDSNVREVQPCAAQSS